MFFAKEKKLDYWVVLMRIDRWKGSIIIDKLLIFSMEEVKFSEWGWNKSLFRWSGKWDC